MKLFRSLESDVYQILCRLSEVNYGVCLAPSPSSVVEDELWALPTQGPCTLVVVMLIVYYSVMFSGTGRSFYDDRLNWLFWEMEMIIYLHDMFSSLCDSVHWRCTGFILFWLNFRSIRIWLMSFQSFRFLFIHVDDLWVFCFVLFRVMSCFVFFFFVPIPRNVCIDWSV